MKNSARRWQRKIIAGLCVRWFAWNPEEETLRVELWCAAPEKDGLSHPELCRRFWHKAWVDLKYIAVLDGDGEKNGEWVGPNIPLSRVKVNQDGEIVNVALSFTAEIKVMTEKKKAVALLFGFQSDGPESEMETITVPAKGVAQKNTEGEKANVQ